ncbi:cyclase family protein [Natronoglycomyces albus]|uniref:Cyclase family protein n=1 Tax=Natronoglycomyces albus TaxID=2811108 RepID=A0A895XIV0_9ACTN|nr:cyclase family protein [Natronoglycomyces albus]QSB05721.1 cyclase family protein [Natronoglycomyces albus]
MSHYRAAFDAEITFSNGGGISVHGFRLDIPGPTISHDALATLLVRHLGLLMVDQVTFSKLEIIEEPHKGSRGGPSDPAAAVAAQRREKVELSHVIEEGMTTYPGLPGPTFTDHLSRADSRDSYAPGTEFAIGRIDMVGNTGTYLDSPFHRYAEGSDLADLPLDSVADVPIVVVDLTGSAERGITARALAPYDLAGAAVLLHTGWDAHWRTQKYGDAHSAPYVTEDGANYLVEAGAVLVGIDAVNIDDTTGDTRPAHSILLAARVPVLEHMTNLGQLPLSGARLHAAPPRVRGFGTFPVRAYALV